MASVSSGLLPRLGLRSDQVGRTRHLAHYHCCHCCYCYYCYGCYCVLGSNPKLGVVVLPLPAGKAAFSEEKTPELRVAVLAYFCLSDHATGTPNFASADQSEASTFAPKPVQNAPSMLLLLVSSPHTDAQSVAVSPMHVGESSTRHTAEVGAFMHLRSSDARPPSSGHL